MDIFQRNIKSLSTESTNNLFFDFLANEQFSVKTLDIYETLIKSNVVDRLLDELINFSWPKNEKISLISIFIFKSVNKTTVNPHTKDISFNNSDLVINQISLYISQLTIFYSNKETANEYELKKNIFKVVAYLVEEGVIEERIIKTKVKTLKEWSFGFETINLTPEEHFNIEHEPFKLIEIAKNYYLRGHFFTKIHKVFIENFRSGEKFEFASSEYLEKLIALRTYLCRTDLNDVITIVEKREGMSEESIENSIKDLNTSIKKQQGLLKGKDQELIDDFKKKISIETEASFNDFNFKTINYVDEFLENLFISFCLNYLEKEKNIIIGPSQIADFSVKLKHLFKGNNLKDTKSGYKFRKLKKEEEGFGGTGTPENVHTDLGCLIGEIIENCSDLDNIGAELVTLGIENNYIKGVLFMTNDEIKYKLKANHRAFLSIKSTAGGSSLHKKVYSDLSINSKKLILRASHKFLNKSVWKGYFEKKKLVLTPLINEIRGCHSRLSKLLFYLNLYSLKKLIKEENTLVYFPFSFDFRGRFYLNSTVSPTNFKLSRYIYNYGYYTHEEVNNNQTNKISAIINEYDFYINRAKIFFKIPIKSTTIEEGVFWTLISMGKIGINKNQIETPISEILEKSFELIEKKENLNNLIDQIELMHYKKILYSYSKGHILKRCLLKDATASFIQNLIRLLGYKNEDSLKYANLSSTTHWYDTYSFILDKWKEDEKDADPQLLNLFTRKTVKKAIMTSPYSARYITSFGYFKEAVKENFNVDIGFGSHEEKIFKKFYSFISTKMETTYFLKHNSTEVIKLIDKAQEKKDECFIIASHDSSSNLKYYKLVSKNFDVILKMPGKSITKRITKRYQQIDKQQIDYGKIKSSIRANWVHYIDALLLRDINNCLSSPCLTIHDCFMVGNLEVSNFIIVANKQSNIKIFESYHWNKGNDIETFSIFIFI